MGGGVGGTEGGQHTGDTVSRGRVMEESAVCKLYVNPTGTHLSFGPHNAREFCLPCTRRTKEGWREGGGGDRRVETGWNEKR